MWEGKKGKEIRKHAQWVETAGLMASRPTRINRGKEEVNGSRKPNEWNNKFMGIIRGKKEVNPRTELVNSMGWLEGQ